MKQPFFPALTTNQPLRLLTVTAMYFAQGIQTGLLLTAIPAYLASQEVDPVAIGGFIGVVMLPWTFKLISAPLMDRYSFLPMGRRRPWVILGMLGAVIGYLTMGMVDDPINNLSTLLTAGLIVSSSTAFMDVAIDGMTIDIIEPEEYAKANSFMNGGNIIGFAGTSAVASWLMSQYGLSFTLLIVALVMGLLALFPLLLRERIGERLLPWTAGQPSEASLKIQMDSWGEIARNLFKVFFLPASLALVFISFIAGMTYGFLQAFLPTLTVQELGWENTAYTSMVATAGLIAGILGVFIASPIISKVGTVKGVKLFLGGFVLIGLLIGLTPMLWEQIWPMQTFIFSYYIIRTLFLIALFTACMTICWETIAATQFTLYMSLSNLGISLGAILFSGVKPWASYPQLFFVFVAVNLLGIVVLSKISLEKHAKRLESL